MATNESKSGVFSSTAKPTTAGRKMERERAQHAGLAEVRAAADKQRDKSEKLKQLRLERDAGLPLKKKAAARKPAKSDLNLAQTQKIAKK